MCLIASFFYTIEKKEKKNSKVVDPFSLSETETSADTKSLPFPLPDHRTALMDKSSPDLCDWEVLHNSDSSDLGEFDHHPQLDSNSHAVFQSDYFSFDSHRKLPSSEDGSVVSDNPSWVDPATDTPFPATNSVDFWSDSGPPSPNLNADVGHKLEDSTTLVKEYWSGSDSPFTATEDFGAEGENNNNINNCPPDSLGVVMDPSNKKEAADDGAVNEEKKGENPRVIWWKLPLDLFKYCVFRVSPVWSFSVAAALVGFVILGRRLYKMKRKTHALHLKVIIDDKKVSQFMSRAARLNEAFSVVRRVPVVRPSLPAPGAATWPVMSMR